VIAILGVIHFWMIVKSDVFYPAIFGFIVAVLLGYRFVANRKATAAKSNAAAASS
jgi:DMSO/TMAO reductase YedYZ heme-binding membrane subunit